VKVGFLPRWRGTRDWLAPWSDLVLETGSDAKTQRLLSDPVDAISSPPQRLLRKLSEPAGGLRDEPAA
jgi:hypothetical protein